MSKSKKIIFTGIGGLLGGYFLKNKDTNYTILGVNSRKSSDSMKGVFKVDIADKNSIFDFVKTNEPEVIVHAASIGNVDYCETHPDEAYSVNVEGTRNIVLAAHEVGARLIFISSNAVYDGENFPFDEKSKENPIDVYGQTKVKGENLLRKSNLSYVILRLMTMYGWPQPGGRANPATWIISKLKKGESINVVNDVYNNHLWAGQAADVIWKIIGDDQGINTYNIAGKDCISRFELALKVAKVFNFDSSLINPVKSSFFKNLAARPKNTCFNVSKLEKELKVIPLTVDEGLKLMKEEKHD